MVAPALLIAFWETVNFGDLLGTLLEHPLPLVFSTVYLKGVTEISTIYRPRTF